MTIMKPLLELAMLINELKNARNSKYIYMHRISKKDAANLFKVDLMPSFKPDI